MNFWTTHASRPALLGCQLGRSESASRFSLIPEGCFLSSIGEGVDPSRTLMAGMGQVVREEGVELQQALRVTTGPPPMWAPDTQRAGTLLTIEDLPEHMDHQF